MKDSNPKTKKNLIYHQSTEESVYSFQLVLFTYSLLHYYRTHKTTTNQKQRGTQRDGSRLGRFFQGLRMAHSVSERHGEACRGARRGASSGGSLLLSESLFRRRNDLLCFQSVSSALCYRICSSVHLQPRERWLDHPCLSLHG